jgi:hypothetical protein
MGFMDCVVLGVFGREHPVRVVQRVINKTVQLNIFVIAHLLISATNKCLINVCVTFHYDFAIYFTCPQDGGSRFLSNIATYLQNYTVSYLRQ